MESLSPSKRRSQTPPAPPPRSFPVEDTSSDAPASKLPKFEDLVGPEKPPRAHVFEKNSDYLTVTENTDGNTEINTNTTESDTNTEEKQVSEDSRQNQVEDSDISSKSAENHEVGENSQEGVAEAEAPESQNTESSQEHVGNSVESR